MTQLQAESTKVRSLEVFVDNEIITDSNREEMLNKIRHCAVGMFRIDGPKAPFSFRMNLKDLANAIRSQSAIGVRFALEVFNETAILEVVQEEEWQKT